MLDKEGTVGGTKISGNLVAAHELLHVCNTEWIERTVCEEYASHFHDQPGEEQVHLENKLTV